MKVERHEWKDKLGDDWALETVVDPPHETTIDGFVTRNMGGQPMLRMPGYTSQQTIQDELAREILRLADENAALMADAERLKKALDQAVGAGSLDVVTVVKDKSYGMWRYEGVECIVGQSSTENFFASVTLPADMPELAAYLKETA